MPRWIFVSLIACLLLLIKKRKKFINGCRFSKFLFDYLAKRELTQAIHIGEMIMSNEANTVRLHRVLRAPAERVYKAFIDKSALERWLPPYGFTGTIHTMDARVEGGYKMSFTNFGTGSSHSFTVKFTELVENQYIQHKDRFDDENLPGEMTVSITLKTVLCGTDISIIQEGIPSVIPTEMCYLGWQESLEQLAKLVEPVIPDNG
jgi:uncharacterized protein YndB with AHSA1/START domain